MQQVADPGSGQVRAGVPVVEHRADVQPVVLADGDQRPRRDEGAQLAGGQLARSAVELDPVGEQEQVAAVPVELRALVVVDGVLDGYRVQAARPAPLPR
jgi:hypothetical protein